MTRKELTRAMHGAYHEHGAGYDGMSAVLDLLTKEAVSTRRHARWKDERPGTMEYFAMYAGGPEVELIVLDLPDKPSASKRAAGYLRSTAELVGGLGLDVDDMLATADELEKEAP